MWYKWEAVLAEIHIPHKCDVLWQEQAELGRYKDWFFWHRMEAYEILFAMCLFHLNRALPILYYIPGSALKNEAELSYSPGKK